ncbi:zinc metalloprotease family m13 neprilysin-related [Holotrichia oblita]|uniref:Zinc metalloprotease family m13 neprilysin-related n=1 Tax=Holotrichia oblita TaxID=644536 RepID=A0ACB9TFY2_HOLOL|nr:zinc metalloprotease family m13 neprilysin-related [Holotrichia oblita]
MSKVRLPVNKTHWTQHSDCAVVNAYYNRIENSIYFPAGILQGVYFNEGRPNYMNYGGIGCVITHEITHAFDIQGSQYNEHGILVNWWSNETKKAYNEKVKCVIEQFNNFKAEEINMQVNGENTLPENIADIGGIKNAYSAYEKILKEVGEEPNLPGLNYNNRQMFWLAAGTAGCAKLRNEALKLEILTDEHAPRKFRVWGLVTNMPEFARDFNCSKTSKMNPDKKCNLW